MAEEKLSKLEKIKDSSNFLVGSIPQELEDDSANFSKDNAQLLKFHGIYQQTDRDTRKSNKSSGKGVDYSFMVRTALPGGLFTSEQYVLMDELCDSMGAGNMRLTTRQGIQYHHITKKNLRPLIKTLNEKLVTTFSKCGDVVRNINCCPAPFADREASEIMKWSEKLDEAVRPKTNAYMQVWVNGEKEQTETITEEPLYGATYLPRKFKIGFAFPGDNCIDVHSHDVGIVPVMEGNKLTASTILVGGGFGNSHAKKDTYPRMASPICDCKPEEMIDVVKVIITIQRDHGNRVDRAHARMKYLIDSWGLEKFKAEMDSRFGSELPAPSKIEWKTGEDHFGWYEQANGDWFYGLFVENGRIVDSDDSKLRTGIRKIVDKFSPELRFTAQQNILFCNIKKSDKDSFNALMAEHGITRTEDIPKPIKQAMACPALPTCGLALTESERALPEIIRSVDKELEKLGLKDFDIFTRMTGCPNGCARPYSAELGIVGRSVGKFNIYLGGSRENSRLNELYAEKVSDEDLVPTIAQVLGYFKESRNSEEAFGDFCARVGVEKLRNEFGISIKE